MTFQNVEPTIQERAAHRQTGMRCCVLLVCLLSYCPLAAAPARVYFVRGTVGALNNWALELHMEQPASLPSTRASSGLFSLRHTGICTTNERNLKNGTATATVRGDSLYDLALTFDDEVCILAGPVKLAPVGEHNFMRCSKSKQVPIITWSDSP